MTRATTPARSASAKGARAAVIHRVHASRVGAAHRRGHRREAHWVGRALGVAPPRERVHRAVAEHPLGHAEARGARRARRPEAQHHAEPRALGDVHEARDLAEGDVVGAALVLAPHEGHVDGVEAQRAEGAHGVGPERGFEPRGAHRRGAEWW